MIDRLMEQNLFEICMIKTYLYTGSIGLKAELL